ncbi:MAG: hypothetical protein J2P48_19310 [Alphaproteobacteria bacterium]|nr:hypothetical protein [Alphaproteobacteria bacterium]
MTPVGDILAIPQRGMFTGNPSRDPHAAEAALGEQGLASAARARLAPPNSP